MVGTAGLNLSKTDRLFQTISFVLFVLLVINYCVCDWLKRPLDLKSGLTPAVFV